MLSIRGRRYRRKNKGKCVDLNLSDSFRVDLTFKKPETNETFASIIFDRSFFLLKVDGEEIFFHSFATNNTRVKGE